MSAVMEDLLALRVELPDVVKTLSASVCAAKRDTQECTRMYRELEALTAQKEQANDQKVCELQCKVDALTAELSCKSVQQALTEERVVELTHKMDKFAHGEAEMKLKMTQMWASLEALIQKNAKTESALQRLQGDDLPRVDATLRDIDASCGKVERCADSNSSRLDLLAQQAERLEEESKKLQQTQEAQGHVLRQVLQARTACP